MSVRFNVIINSAVGEPGNGKNVVDSSNKFEPPPKKSTFWIVNP